MYLFWVTSPSSDPESPPGELTLPSEVVPFEVVWLAAWAGDIKAKPSLPQPLHSLGKHRPRDNSGSRRSQPRVHFSCPTADQVWDWSFFSPQETCPHPVITCLTLHTWGMSALVHWAHIKVSQTFFSFTGNFRTSLRGAKQKGYFLYYIIEKCREGLCLGQSWPQLSPRLPTVRLWYPPSDFLLRPAFSHHLAKVVCIVQ